MTDDQINESMAKDPAAYHKARHDPTAYERKVLSDVLDAWVKQRDKGFDLKHDLSHSDGDLSRAAAAYSLHGTTYAKANGLPSFWPWPDWFNPEGRRSNLVRAAAFLLSEIARFDAEKGPFGNEDKP
jgi:hypothetical protein